MKRIATLLLCLINCMEGRIFTSSQKHPKPQSSIHFNTDSSEVVQPHVTSKKELRASFDTLTSIGYMTHMQRWITYLWKGNTKEREAQERLEKELSGIIYERGVDNSGFARIRSKGDQALFGGQVEQSIF